MRNSSTSERLMYLMAETVSLLDAARILREGLESQPDAEDTLDALELVRSSFAQAFDTLKIAENEAVTMEARQRVAVKRAARMPGIVAERRENERVQLVSDAAEAVELFDEDELERWAEAERMQYEQDEDDTPTEPML